MRVSSSLSAMIPSMSADALGLVLGIRSVCSRSVSAAVLRHVERKDAGAERVLARRERRGEVGAGLVELGDDDRPRHVDGGALVPQHPGGAVDRVDRADDEQRCVGGPKAGAQFADEVGVAGGVDQVDLDLAAHQGSEREAHAALLAVLGRVVVADGGACGDRAGARDRPAGRQQHLGQGRLACARVPDQHHVAHAAECRRHRGAGIRAFGCSPDLSDSCRSPELSNRERWMRRSAERSRRAGSVPPSDRASRRQRPGKEPRSATRCVRCIGAMHQLCSNSALRAD